ncbi:hypothetical protein [Microcella humidisoli]|uniref:Uncharacterized protein n=1 Tax=Microcella humidisoli TaxID=2963406 RepID=A0ABY5FYX3_9MICO|nr:hypothetical protein [Microcella humidisoli]UTT63520.1 hypothetical protein NNL39_05315 [Microcella humidisoli]
MVLIHLHINSPLQPMHRGDVVEDPLLAALSAEIDGVEIVDAGTLSGEDYRLVSCDVVFAVPPIAAYRAGRLLVAECDRIGMTRGSTVTIKGLEPTPVGRMAGVRVRLPDLVDVDGEDERYVYFSAELTRLVTLVGERLGDVGTVWSWRVREDLGSDITVHGRESERIIEALREILGPEPSATNMSFEVFA